MNSQADRPVVAVFGSYEPADGSDGYHQAYLVGHVLGELGYAIANGGYGGTMEASARGCKEAGSSVVGVTCAIWSSRPNRYVDEVIVTPDLSARVKALAEQGTGGYVVLPGGNGTLVELATVWEARSLGKMSDRPIACIGEFWKPVVDLIGSVRPAAAKLVHIVQQAEQLREHFAPRDGA